MRSFIATLFAVGAIAIKLHQTAPPPPGEEDVPSMDATTGPGPATDDGTATDNGTAAVLLA